jgi:hypothetical protein
VLLDLAPLEGPDNLCVDAGSELSVLELYGAIGRLLDESHRTETLAVNYAQVSSSYWILKQLIMYYRIELGATQSCTTVYIQRFDRSVVALRHISTETNALRVVPYTCCT